MRFVIAGILVPIGGGVSIFVEVPDADEAVFLPEHRLGIADVRRARMAPLHDDRLVFAVAFDHIKQHPYGGRPGLLVP